jgi:hypothetical protein
MRKGSACRVSAERRGLLFAAASALTLSFSLPAFGRAEWLITADEIEAAKKVLHRFSSAPDADEIEAAKKALHGSQSTGEGNEIEAARKASQGSPSAAMDAKPSAPSISILKPVESGQIIAPVDFDVRFAPVPPAHIDPSSIKVIYSGLFDITNRIREFGGKVDASGILLSKAPLKPDVYRVTVAVADSAGRMARQAVRFTVI